MICDSAPFDFHFQSLEGVGYRSDQSRQELSIKKRFAASWRLSIRCAAAFEKN